MMSESPFSRHLTILQQKLNGWDLCYSGLRQIACELGLLPGVPLTGSYEEGPEADSLIKNDYHRSKVLREELRYLEESFDPFRELLIEVKAAVSTVPRDWATEDVLLRLYESETETGFDSFWGFRCSDWQRYSTGIPGIMRDPGSPIDRQSVKWHVNRRRLRDHLNHEHRRSPLISATNSAWRITRFATTRRNGSRKFVAVMLKSGLDRCGVRYQTAPELATEYDLDPVPKEKFGIAGHCLPDNQAHFIYPEHYLVERWIFAPCVAFVVRLDDFHRWYTKQDSMNPDPRSVYEGLRRYTYRLAEDGDSVDVAMANLRLTAD